MTANRTSPFMLPDEGAVAFGSWEVFRGDEWQPASPQFDGWDPGAEIPIRRRIEVDVEAVRLATQLPDLVPLAIVTAWESSTTRMTGCAGKTAVTESDLVVHSATLPGNRIGGTLRIRTSLVLDESWAGEPGVAHLGGSVLAEDESRIALEGTTSMFPVAVIDFAHTPYDPDASWHLDTSTDLEAPFMGRFQLEINARDTELVDAIGAAKPSGRQLALLEDLQQGVAMLMLEFAQLLNSEDSISQADWPPDSIGDALNRVLASAGAEDAKQAPTPLDIADQRSAIEGSTRRSGHGRSFK